MDNVIEFNQVWKKFRKGEKFNSLRDAVPNFFKKAVQGNGGLEEQEFWAVKDVSFNIKKGEVVGIMGPNGAGKSTILKLLSRIIIPNKGSMKINGRLSALIEVTAGFHPELTGRENVYLNGTILGMRRKEIDTKFDEIVEFSGIKEFIETPVKRYSSGMYSRLGFSVAAHMNPDILLVDEVLSVGDIAFQSKCSEKMRELLHSGVTIALVSHNLSLMQSLCQRVILLDKGEVLKDGRTDEVIPYYENIVYKQQEEDLKKKIHSSSDYQVKISDQSLLEINDVSLCADAGQTKEIYKSEDLISATVRYKANRPIEDPGFCIEIIRSDGVLCCGEKSNHAGFKAGEVSGEGALKISFGKIRLGPGVYVLKVTIFDKGFIHALAVHQKCILKIEAEKGQADSAAIFLPKFIWSVER